MYHLTWKGWSVKLPRGRPAPAAHPELNWKRHPCVDNRECRSPIGGGCARGWCSHFDVKPDRMGVSRYPRTKFRRPDLSRPDPGAPNDMASSTL